MTSIGIQCNIEHANSDCSSTSKSVTIQAKNELLYDNDDRDQYKSYLVHDLHRSEADGMSLSQTFAENGETSSEQVKEIQGTSQEATINSEHSIPIVAPKRNGAENVNRQIGFVKDLKHDNRTQKQKPLAVVAPFLSDTEPNDTEETVLKTISIGDGEGMDTAFNPNMQNAIVRQQDRCSSKASHQESEQMQNNDEDIYFVKNSTEPFVPDISYSLTSTESTHVSGDENCLDRACSALKSDDITKTHKVLQSQELSGSKSTEEEKIARDFGDEQSYNIYQNGKSCLFQFQTSNNILNSKDSKGQNILSSLTHFTKRYLRKNTNAHMNKGISRRQRFRMGRPLCKVRLDGTISKQHCKNYTRKIKIKGKFGLGNKIPPKDNSTVKFKVEVKSGVKDTNKCKSLSNKESLNIIFLPGAEDQLMVTNTPVTDISSKPDISLTERQISCRLKETPLKKSGNKQDIQSKNILTKNHKGSKENKSSDLRGKCKGDIQPKISQTKKVIRVNNKLILQTKKNAHALFYFGYKFGTQLIFNWHTLYSSIIKWTDLDFGSIQLTVSPARELIYCVYFENESRRRQTFCTYDNQDIVERLVRNGFFYSEGENQIVCYICGGRHGRLRAGDIPERAHHSGCQFHSEADPGNHTEVRERERNRSTRGNVIMQCSSNSTQTSPGSNMVSGRVLLNVPQVLIDYFRRHNDPGGGRGGRPITVIPPFPFDEAQEHRRHITVLPPRPDMNGGRRRRRITVLPPRPPSQEFVAPSHGSVIHTHQRTEPISTSSMPIPLPHRCVFCRTRPVSIRFEPCQHALACYLCSLNKVICIVCGESIVQISYMENRQ
ncbi:hypothetical protein ACJMK2_018982 [Sinanodonta woodiana]|uniref:RING-type domain-containing protein n=1 Tax=Sinanodonta woodiana TaxID=1069815 RepID=A0ABD3UJ21_SINWO